MIPVLYNNFSQGLIFVRFGYPEPSPEETEDEHVTQLRIHPLPPTCLIAYPPTAFHVHHGNQRARRNECTRAKLGLRAPIGPISLAGTLVMPVGLSFFWQVVHAHVSLSVSSVPFLFIILGSVLTGVRFWVQVPMADFKFLRFEVYVVAPTNGKFKIRTANRTVDLTCSFIHWQELPTRWRCGEAQQACYSVRCIQLDSSWITANRTPETAPLLQRRPLCASLRTSTPPHNHPRASSAS